MSIKDILRKMRLLRTAYYKGQWKKVICKIPAQEYTAGIARLEAYKNKYKGQRCVVIGNGPSLTPQDLDMLKDEITFASNRIYNVYSKTQWRPTFLCAQDLMVIDDICEKLPEASLDSELTILTTGAYDRCKERAKDIKNLVWMPLRYIPPKNDRYVFSDDASKMVAEGLTITYSCLQLAAYMGFTEIYLLGIDHNYSIEIDKNGKIVKQDNSVKNYFQGGIEIKPGNFPQVIEMTNAYMSAEPYSRNHGFRIFNATRGGKLEVFERKNFDEVFGKK